MALCLCPLSVPIVPTPHCPSPRLKVRQSTGFSYTRVILDAYRAQGLYGVMYRGYFPWGAAQAVTKGLPILFVSGEVTGLAERAGFSPRSATILGGVAGGVAQGFVVTPTQRFKTLAMTKPDNLAHVSFNVFLPPSTPTKHPISPITKQMSQWRFATQTIREAGITTIFRGTMPMCFRRGVDWCVRFTGLSHFKAMLEGWSGEKRAWHALVAGFAGGALSATTLPFDCLIANMQVCSSSVDKA